METLARDRFWAVAAIDFELGYLLEPSAIPPAWVPSAHRPLARFWRFRECLELTAEAAESWLLAHAPGLAAGVGGVAPSLDKKGHAAAIARISAYISAGDCYQVNLTFPLRFEWFGHPLDLYARLRERQPVRYGGVVGDGDSALVSLSPELFVERKGGRLLVRPMKGTLARQKPAAELLASEKDRAENLMIVDLLRNDLGRIATPGSIRVEGLFEIEDYPSVWQMVSQISAEAPAANLGEVLHALFPCGSITGAPKIRAMQIAGELESGSRGLYTGALGWVAPDGNFRLNVAIRTLELSAGRTGSLGVGGGIVADSRAGAEWAECLLKAAFLCECDPGLQLIETLRCEGGRYPLLNGHLVRLRRSAAWFGFRLDEEAVVRALAAQPAEGVWRIRLTLDKAGKVAVEAAQLAAEPGIARLALFSAGRIDSRDPLRRHKTTARQLYDAALRSLPAGSPVFDVLFLNERGEVAEGARSNIFVERGGILLTPPLASGALPGVLRAELLAQGQARESVLFPEDLADGFWLGNALRGLAPASLAGLPTA